MIYEGESRNGKEESAFTREKYESTLKKIKRQRPKRLVVQINGHGSTRGLSLSMDKKMKKKRCDDCDGKGKTCRWKNLTWNCLKKTRQSCTGTGSVHVESELVEDDTETLYNSPRKTKQRKTVPWEKMYNDFSEVADEVVFIIVSCQNMVQETFKWTHRLDRGANGFKSCWEPKKEFPTVADGLQQRWTTQRQPS